MSDSISSKIKNKISEDLSPTRNITGFHLKIISGAYLPKYENNRKQPAIITKGKPIALLVASKRIKIPHPPKINSNGKFNVSDIFRFKRTPPLSTN